MSEPKTLLELSGADLQPASLAGCGLIIVDMQNEYLEGPIAVSAAAGAIRSAQGLLTKARNTGSFIVHIAHKGRAGGLFDRNAERGQIIEELAPLPDEVIVEKELPNAFAGTDLQELLQKSGCKDIIIIGFMTHMCVSSTARAAIEFGFRVTVDAQCCATRDLPDGVGGKIDADTVHQVALVELSDRFAIIARDHDWQ